MHKNDLEDKLMSPEVIMKAWGDKSYLKKLSRLPKETLGINRGDELEGISVIVHTDIGDKVHVVFPNELHKIRCFLGEQNFVLLKSRVDSDQEFAALARERPIEVLGMYGVDLPKNIKIVSNSKHEINLVVPVSPFDLREMELVRESAIKLAAGSTKCCATGTCDNIGGGLGLCGKCHGKSPDHLRERTSEAPGRHAKNMKI
ncbi:NHLP leader peptide domain protein [compost metagenome]